MVALYMAFSTLFLEYFNKIFRQFMTRAFFNIFKKYRELVSSDSEHKLFQNATILGYSARSSTFAIYRFVNEIQTLFSNQMTIKIQLYIIYVSLHMSNSDLRNLVMNNNAYFFGRGS
jgi:adenine C2-methylase RlmN of 23S rRNA A2503 and tRNA A37